VLFGAMLTAEGGPVELGEGCIVMNNAVSNALAVLLLDDHRRVRAEVSVSGIALRTPRPAQ
jgi:hypothetical protein